MSEQSLFPLVVDRAACTIARDEHSFWSLTISVQFEGRAGMFEQRVSYDSLSFPELVDVLLSELHRTL